MNNETKIIKAMGVILIIISFVTQNALELVIGLHGIFITLMIAFIGGYCIGETIK